MATKKYIDNIISKGFIQPSKSLVSSPTIMVTKQGGGGGLRFYVDYYALNIATIKNHYPIPKMRETFAHLYKAKYFTKLDIIVAFHNLHMKKGYE